MSRPEPPGGQTDGQTDSGAPPATQTLSPPQPARPLTFLVAPLGSLLPARAGLGAPEQAPVSGHGRPRLLPEGHGGGCARGEAASRRCDSGGDRGRGRGRGWGRRNGGSRRSGARAASAASCRGGSRASTTAPRRPAPGGGCEGGPRGTPLAPASPCPAPASPCPGAVPPPVARAGGESAGEGQSPAAPAGGRPRGLGAAGGKDLGVPGDAELAGSQRSGLAGGGIPGCTWGATPPVVLPFSSEAAQGALGPPRGSPVKGKPGCTGESPAKGRQVDEGTGVPLL